MWHSAVGCIVTLALSLLVMGLAATVQPAGKVHRIGLLRAGPAGPDPMSEAFRQGLHDLGYVDGQNLVIEARYAEGRAERFPDLAAELVQLQVEVIVAGGNPAVHAAQQATRTIPIVMVGGGADPVAAGLIASLGHPGGNITGLSSQSAELSGKQLEFLKETVPMVSRIAVLTNPANPASPARLPYVQAAAQALRVQLRVLEVQSREDLERAFAVIQHEGIGAFLVPSDALLLSWSRSDIAAFALRHRLPAMYGLRADVEAGGLMAYGASLPDMFRRAASYVDRLLKGATPADLPVEQPTKFTLVINLKTAQAMGLTIPPTLLFQANEVIK